VDWRLRGALLLALAVLVPFALVESGHHVVRAATPTAATRSTPATPATTGRQMVAIAPTGPRATRDGCGLSFSASAPTAPVGRCTVVEIGDSLGNDIGWGIQRHLPSASGLQLHQLDRSSTGLADTSYFDWPAQLATALQQYHPDLVLICLGGNDQQGFDVDGSPVEFGTPAWKSAYLDRVQQLISEATDAKAEVLWVGLPVMMDPSYNAGAETLNDLYEEAVSGDPDATFLSTWSLFADAGGNYHSEAQVDGSLATLRQADGIHLSFVGEDVIATYVIRAIASIGHVDLAPVAPAVVTDWP
jgi:uncharacterized protein